MRKVGRVVIALLRKAVITAAGDGSRLLPLSKGMSKVMLPHCARTLEGRIILKPVIEAVYESIYDYGCRDFCFIVGRDKRAIMDYFLIDHSAKYSANSSLQGLYKRINSSRIKYVHQPSPLGFGDAILSAKSFVGDESFLLHVGDDVILSSDNRHIKRLEDAFFSNDADIAFLVDRVENPEEYGVVEGKRIGSGILRVEQVEEKPRRPKTNLAIVAAYVFKPWIFSEMERTKPDENGEIEISNAIISRAASGKCIAVELEAGEKRMDVGTPESYVACIRNSFENARDGAYT